MSKMRTPRFAIPLLMLALFFPFAAQAEVIEEIVAWVDGSIITLSEVEGEEQALMAELYKQLQGDELEDAVNRTKSHLLQQMVDRKLMLARASRMFDLEAIGDSYLSMFRRQQEITSDEELEKMLIESGFTLARFRQQLIDRYAPDEILRMEVNSRVAVSDTEIAAYYEENKDRYRVPAVRTVREIVLLADTDDVKAEKRPLLASIREQAMQPDADFVALAIEHSESGTAQSGGSLGTVGKGDLSEALDTAAFSLATGEISEILEISYGLHLLMIEDGKDEYLQPLEEMTEGIRTELEDRQYEKRLNEFLTKLRSESKIRVASKFLERYPLLEEE